LKNCHHGLAEEYWNKVRKKVQQNSPSNLKSSLGENIFGDEK